MERELEARVAIGEYASTDELLLAAVEQLFTVYFPPGELDRLCEEGLEDIRAGRVIDGEQAIRDILTQGRAARASSEK